MPGQTSRYSNLQGSGHLGDHGSALDALEQAVEERDVRLTFLAIEPRWTPLLNTPRFESVRTRVGLTASRNYLKR
jgi:hypothetical protein